MKTNPEFIARDIADELVLVPVGTAAKSFGGLVTCNEVGAFIWKTLETERPWTSLSPQYSTSLRPTSRPHGATPRSLSQS